MAEEEEVASKGPPAVVMRLAEASKEIAALSDFRNAYRRPLTSLSRRIKLLAPMFDELQDGRAPLPEGALRSLASLEGALAAAKDLLRFVVQGSKIAMMLERDTMMKRFQYVSTQLEQAISELVFDELDISDEVQEQVELVKSQFRRAKEKIEMPDAGLFADLTSLYKMTSNENAKEATLERLAEGLQLMTIPELTQESLALHEMVVANGGGDPDESIEHMSMLLKKVKDFVQTRNPEIGNAVDQKLLHLCEKHMIPIIPDEFRCPISLDLMKDPVIVATGQTYERSCIEKWIESGHDTCPKTQQTLSKKSIIPNYVLRSLIDQWCEDNGIELSRSSLQHHKPASVSSSNENPNVDALLQNLLSPSLDDQRAAAGELRLLAKRNVGNRIRIAEAGAIPLLVSLLSSLDARTQEHAVTCLLNLSIHEENKARIIRAGAVPEIIYVLRNGSMEARENAAAALFSLSVVDENKVLIGASGAIPALTSLLSEGTHRGRKDAATAIFNLCIFQGNKAKAVSAGVVPLIMRILGDPAAAMVDEAMAILAVLSSHPDGKTAILAARAVPILVQMMEIGSPRNKENAAAILVNLSAGELQPLCLSEAQECGMMGSLREMAVSGTDRGRRKAAQLLELMNRFLEKQHQSEVEAESGPWAFADAGMQSPVNVLSIDDQSQVHDNLP